MQPPHGYGPPGYPPQNPYGYNPPPQYPPPQQPPPPPRRGMSGAAIVLIILAAVIVLGIGGCFMCMCGVGALGSLGSNKPAPQKPSATGVQDPVRACALLSGVGLPGRRWRHFLDAEYVCSSEERDLGGVGVDGNSNDLTYIAEGSATTAYRGKIVLDVFAKGSAISAHREMIRASDELFSKTVGGTTPPEIRALIEQGRPGKSVVGGKVARVEREEFRGGSIYTLNLSLEL